MNRNSIKIGLLVSVAAAGSMVTVPAFAQEGSSDSNTGSDIIVTAQRVEQRLQDVPISITVFNQEQIADRNISIASDLGLYTPSLTVDQRYGPEKSSFTIRGFVQDPSTAPSVGTYFADVVVPRAFGGTTSGDTLPVGSFMDIENVQVLKGPQGTLFGRNTTGGAVLVVPKKPNGNLEGYIEGSLGDYSLRRVQGAINIPLADTFKIRIAADRQQRDGYIVNHSGIGPRDYNNLDYFAARLSIVADLTPDLENYTIASYSHSFSHGVGQRLLACNRALNGSIFTNRPACNQIDRQNARGDGPLDVEINNVDPYLDLKTWQIINTTTWEASDTLRVKNIISYAEFRENANWNLNGDNFTSDFGGSGPFPGGVPFRYIVLSPAPGLDTAAQSTFTEELQFQGKSFDSRLTWQVGGYAEVSRTLNWNAGYVAILANCINPVDLGTCKSPFTGVGSITNSQTRFSFDNRGLYAQGTYDITDQLAFTAGIRYTWDKTLGIGQGTKLLLAPNGGFVTRSCNDVVRFFDGVPGKPLVVDAPEKCREAFPAKSSAPTWLLGLDFKPTPDILLYAKYMRGYRQGGVNLTSIGLEGWNPEKVDSYEVGAKTSFRGKVSGYFNFAGFYNDFSNQQLTVNAISNVPGFSGASPIVNAGKSRIYGAEVDASAKFFDSLTFSVGYTYLNTKLISINLPAIPIGAPYSQLIPRDSAGSQLALSPKNRVTLSATYELPLDESIGHISFGATFIHTDDIQFTLAAPLQFQRLPATDVLNLNVNWRDVAGQPIDLAFFMTNVANEISLNSVSNSYASAAYVTGTYSPPRMWGVRARYKFGN